MTARPVGLIRRPNCDSNAYRTARSSPRYTVRRGGADSDSGIVHDAMNGVTLV